MQFVAVATPVLCLLVPKRIKQRINTPKSILGIETTFKMAHLLIDFPVTGWTEE